VNYYLFIANKSSRYDVLPDEDLEPTHPVPGVPLDRQAESMRELRAMHNEIPSGFIRRDRQMQAWALSNSLSRQDMATAVSMHKSRVDQIIRELTLADQAIQAQRALEQVRRHMPEELFQQMLQQDPELVAYEELGITIDEIGILPD
jgi:hypothetical protein